MTLAEAHILLVDDEPMLRLTLGLVLRRQGATVTAAVNGAEALDVLRHADANGHEEPTNAEERPVDLVLTDWHMPVVDGPELLQTMASEGYTVPTVLCTGTLGDGDNLDLPALGVEALMLKPFAPTELLKTLEAVLARLPSRK